MLQGFLALVRRDLRYPSVARLRRARKSCEKKRSWPIWRGCRVRHNSAYSPGFPARRLKALERSIDIAFHASIQLSGQPIRMKDSKRQRRPLPQRMAIGMETSRSAALALRCCSIPCSEVPSIEDLSYKNTHETGSMQDSSIDDGLSGARRSALSCSSLIPIVVDADNSCTTNRVPRRLMTSQGY